MTQETKPYIRAKDGWVCRVCETVISSYDIHGSPVKAFMKCPYCKRHIRWEKVLTNEGYEKIRKGL